MCVFNIKQCQVWSEEGLLKALFMELYCIYIYWHVVISILSMNRISLMRVTQTSWNTLNKKKTKKAIHILHIFVKRKKNPTHISYFRKTNKVKYIIEVCYIFFKGKHKYRIRTRESLLSLHLSWCPARTDSSGDGYEVILVNVQTGLEYYFYGKWRVKDILEVSTDKGLVILSLLEWLN